MKRILLGTTFLVCCCFMAQAQSVAPLLKEMIPSSGWAHVQKIQRLIAQQNAFSESQKPTVIKQRVIAQSSVDFDGFVDSDAFVYSGIRGSKYNYNSLLGWTYPENLPTFYTYHDPTLGLPSAYLQVDALNDYNSQNNMQIGEQSLGHYRSDNRLDTVYNNAHDNGVISQSVKYIRVFNNQQQLTDVYQLTSPSAGAPYDTNMHQAVYYNNNQAVGDTTWNVDPLGIETPESATQFIYNANNKIGQIKTFDYDNNSLQFVADKNTIYSYCDNGKIRSIHVFDTTMPSNATLDSFIYTPGINYYTEWYEEGWFNGSFSYGTYLKLFPNANGLPDSAVAYSKSNEQDPYVKSGTLYYSYNNYNNPVTIKIVSTEGNAFVNFYYEEYDDQTRIKEAAPVSNNLLVSPNPFTGKINILWKAKPFKNVTLKLFDNSGRLVFRKNLNIIVGNNSVNVPNLPSGLYLLQLQDVDGNQWNQKIIKE